MKTFKHIIPAVFLISACAGENNHSFDGETKAPESKVIALSSKQVETIKLQFGKITRRNLSNTIKANGYLDVPPQSKAVISPMITGYVKKVNFLLGDDVKKGQIMAELESMEYIDLQQQYMELKSHLIYLKEDYERQKLLREQDAVSMKKFLKAEVDLNVANSTLEALITKLKLLGNDINELNEGKIQSRILLRAPLSGSVNKLSARIGKHVDPHEEIYELTNTDHLHLELSVYERDVPKIKKGQKVRFKLPSLEHREFEGEVYLVGKNLSEEKRSINVHVHFDDKQANFSVGMYGMASIAIDESSTFSVPARAVVVDGSEKFIFRVVNSTEDRRSFEKIKISTGTEADGYVELLNLNGDLSEKDQIVVNGAFYLLNASGG